MKYKPKLKKPLPKIISGIIDKRTINSFLEEETFDCIKKNIRTYEVGEQVKIPRTKDLTKNYRRTHFKKTKQFLASLYSENDLVRFRKKSERKKEREKLGEYAYFVLCSLCSKKSKKAQRKRKLKPRSRYETYIKSDEWEARKNLYWRTHNRACVVCDSTEHVQLHHMSYEKLKNEPDEHLVALCGDHHQQYHEENGVQRNMIRKTKAFIEKEVASL